MRKIITILFACISIQCLYAQQEPVEWNYSVKKIGSNDYELHLTAKIDPYWHIYAQNQPTNSIATATSVTFFKNPLISLYGPLMEKGEMEFKNYEQLGIEAFQYQDSVDFVQRFKLRIKGIKTNLSGKIEFQACTEESCLPPVTKNFAIKIE